MKLICEVNEDIEVLTEEKKKRLEIKDEIYAMLIAADSQ